MAIRNISDNDQPTYDLREIKRKAFQGIEQLRADVLNIDHRYQRPVGRRYVSRIAREFDARLFGIVTVSQRADGSYWILDGQHRVEALKKMGKGATMIPCEVLSGLTYQQEAHIFDKRNTNVKGMTAQDKFRGGLEANDDLYVRIAVTVSDAGFSVNVENSELTEGRIPGVGSLLSIEKEYRDGMLAETLGLIRATWGTEIGPRGTMISGVAMFISFYRDVWDRRRFITQLQKHTMEHIQRDARQIKDATGASPQQTVCAALVRRYNERLRQENKLPSLEEMRAINLMKRQEADRGN